MLEVLIKVIVSVFIFIVVNLGVGRVPVFRAEPALRILLSGVLTLVIICFFGWLGG